MDLMAVDIGQQPETTRGSVNKMMDMVTINGYIYLPISYNHKLMIESTNATRKQNSTPMTLRLPQIRYNSQDIQQINIKQHDAQHDVILCNTLPSCQQRASSLNLRITAPIAGTITNIERTQIHSDLPNHLWVIRPSQ